MKPAQFEYVRPSTLRETVEVLSRFGDEAKIIAGGQSLVPMMNLRLARPSTLVDISELRELDGVADSADVLELGARVRHVDLERSSLPGATNQLLRLAAKHIGHLPIRTRGTIGGSLAHADPSAEWCLIATTLDAELVLDRVDSQRVVGAGGFFRGYFTTALESDELLTRIRLPKLDGSHDVGFAEYARRAGDFAIVAAATVIEISDGRIASARVGIAGASDRPVRSGCAEAALLGETPNDDVFSEAAISAANACDPLSDSQASADHRRDLVRALVQRALANGRRSHLEEERVLR